MNQNTNSGANVLLPVLSRKLMRSFSSLDGDDILDILETAGRFELWKGGEWTASFKELQTRLTGLHLEKLIGQYFYMFHNNGQKLPRGVEIPPFQLPDFAGLLMELFALVREPKPVRVLKSHKTPAKVTLEAVSDYPAEGADANKYTRASRLSREFNERYLWLLVVALAKNRIEMTTLVVCLLDNRVKIPKLYLALVDPNVIHREYYDQTTNYQRGKSLRDDSEYSSSEYSSEYSHPCGQGHWVTPSHYFSPYFSGKSLFHILALQRDRGNGPLLKYLPRISYWDVNYYCVDQPSPLSTALFILRDSNLVRSLLDRMDLIVSHNYNEIVSHILVNGMFSYLALIKGHPNYMTNREIRKHMRTHRNPQNTSLPALQVSDVEQYLHHKNIFVRSKKPKAEEIEVHSRVKPSSPSSSSTTESSEETEEEETEEEETEEEETEEEETEEEETEEEETEEESTDETSSY